MTTGFIQFILKLMRKLIVPIILHKTLLSSLGTRLNAIFLKKGITNTHRAAVVRCYITKLQPGARFYSQVIKLLKKDFYS